MLFNFDRVERMMDQAENSLYFLYKEQFVVDNFIPEVNIIISDKSRALSIVLTEIFISSVIFIMVLRPRLLS